ncbi:hypothetical protein LguiA_002510 [Lonicera macranthoides]
MGKNQAYKAMQRSRVGSGSGGPEDVDDGMVDGSFHSPEWHAARLASLKTSSTITWEEYKKKQKEEEMKKGEVEADKDKMMKEYRAQLDAERASKLARGRNHSTKSSHKKDKKNKDLKKHSSKKRKHSKRSLESSSSSSSSEYSSSDEEEGGESRRSKSRSKGRKKERRHRSRSKHHHRHSSGEEEADGPVRLSRFFETSKR